MLDQDKAETTPLKTRDPEEQDTVVIENDYEDKLTKSNGGAGVLPMESSEVKVQSQFMGLTKKQLMVYADDPFWVKLRLVVIIMYWLVWVGMLAAAVIIIIFAPKCAPRPDLDWWHTSVGYQVYPRSYKDSNDDGLGDLNGIAEKLDYVNNYLNASMVLINPIYQSNGFGDEAIDYMKIAEDLGTGEDFDKLVKILHKKGMKVVLDFIPNHTSKNHTWFRKSRENNDESNPYRDYYVWSDKKNNWLSVYGRSAWTWDDSRQQYYLHQFATYEPDLNLKNPAVQQELSNILKYWLELNVDGVRITAADYLFEGELTVNESRSFTPSAKTFEYGYLIHDKTTLLPDTYKLITEWRTLLDSFSTSPDRKRLLMVETSADDISSYLEYEDKPGAHVVFSRLMAQLDSDCKTKCLKDFIVSAVADKAADARRSITWALSNGDQHRLARRWGLERVVGLNMMILTLPGIPFVYYGDEIGMTGPNISVRDSKDPIATSGIAKPIEFIRDMQRSPMQWADMASGGFCDTCTPWLPFGNDSPLINVKTQRAAGAGTTALEVFALTSGLRKKPSFLWGDLHMIDAADEVLSYVRKAHGFTGYLAAFNFGDHAATPDFIGANDQLITEYGKIVATTANVKGDRYVDFKIGNRVRLHGFFLRPNEGVIFQLEDE